MKKTLWLAAVTLALLSSYGCQREDVQADDSANARLAGSLDSAGFHSRQRLQRVAVESLPAAIKTYVASNYAGATLNHAAKDDAGRFLVAITQNDEKKALLFNADGTFNAEVNLRDRRGKGPGGHGRGQRDSLVAVTALPAAITQYVNANYAGSTINVAALDNSRGYFVMLTTSANERKTLLFNLDGTFNQEIVRIPRGQLTAVDVATLPPAITTYVNANYAGATIKMAGKTPAGDLVVILQPATGRPVALLFTADGTFKQVLRKGR